MLLLLEGGLNQMFMLSQGTVGHLDEGDISTRVHVVTVIVNSERIIPWVKRISQFEVIRIIVILNIHRS